MVYFRRVVLANLGLRSHLLHLPRKKQVFPHDQAKEKIPSFDFSQTFTAIR
ncbi:hypothetical protein [Nostoc sp.]|uniref:hypothetical protein n=1 Tax=Nostoc sp. TaxID=1180 RepID=UPI002FEEA1C2